jgi:hypothetical protein
MKNPFLRIINYRQGRIRENEENKCFEDPTYHFKILDKKLQFGYFNREIPNLRADKIKFRLKSFSGDSNANAKRKLEYIDKSMYYQLGQNYDIYSFDMAIRKISKKEKVKALLYKISQSLFKLYIILFPILFVSHIIYILSPTKILNLFLTLFTALFYFIFILWIITAFNSSEINLRTTKWFKEYYKRKKNRTQKLLVKTYEKVIVELKHIKNINIKINKNIIALITKQEADKTGILKYYTPAIISSFFFVLLENKFIKDPDDEKINIQRFILSVFYMNRKERSLRIYFNEQNKKAGKVRGRLYKMLEKTHYQISNNFKLLEKDKNKEEINISQYVQDDVEYLYNEIMKSNFKLNIREDHFRCLMEVFFTNINQDERIVLDMNKYLAPCLNQVGKILDTIIKNAI